MKEHKKHTTLKKPVFGEFGRHELSILGTPCGNIKKLSRSVISRLGPSRNISYIDADHKSADDHINDEHLVLHGGSRLFTDKIDYYQMDWKGDPNPFQQKKWYQDQDLIIINGNHFESMAQIVVVDEKKSLEKKLSKLNNVVLVLIKDNSEVPDYLRALVNGVRKIDFKDTDAITTWIDNYIEEHHIPLYGLVLAGGKSVRMQRDKGKIAYHGLPQREHAWNILDAVCEQTFISCREDQEDEIDNKYNPIPDVFLGLGPFGGILSAFRRHPDVAWLTVASDLPFLDDELVSSLITKRNKSKVATAYWDPDHKFPEPLITIWEPRAYPELLHFLSLGYSCPRKALINTNVELIEASDTKKLMNVNSPDEYEMVATELSL